MYEVIDLSVRPAFLKGTSEKKSLSLNHVRTIKQKERHNALEASHNHVADENLRFARLSFRTAGEEPESHSELKTDHTC